MAKTRAWSQIGGMTDHRTAQLQRAIEKAAVRATRQSDHPVTQDELLALRVQILPASKRLLFGFLSLAFGCLAWVLSDLDYFWFSLLSGLASLASLFFAVIGVRRTVSMALDGFDQTTSQFILEAAVDAATCVVSAALD